MLEAWWALDQLSGKGISPGDHRSFLRQRYKEDVGLGDATHGPRSLKQLTHSNEPLAQLVGMGFAIPQRQGWPSSPSWAVLM